MSSSKPVLWESDITSWREEKAKLETKISAAQRRLVEVNRLLELVAALEREKGPPSKIDESALVHPDEPIEERLEPMPTAVMAIVRQYPGLVARPLIKKELAKAGYPAKRLGNYFYTVMHRLVERGSLVREKQGYRLRENGDADPANEEASSAPHKDLLDASIETGHSVQ